VYGGFAATMLDFACGYAVLSKLTPGMRFSTLELKVAYHKAITKDTSRIHAEGTIVTMGRRAAFTDARLVDAHGCLYASVTSSLLVRRCDPLPQQPYETPVPDRGAKPFRVALPESLLADLHERLVVRKERSHPMHRVSEE
jgi:uncharacterized protein (TIGR00369 family)